MSNMKLSIGGVEYRNPVFCASGCFGYGYEIEKYTTMSRIGAVSLKSVTLNSRLGNKPPRVCEVSAGMLSSIGIQNPGIGYFLQQILPKSQKVLERDQLIISIAGSTTEDYLKAAAILSSEVAVNDIAALEVNCACPNVSTGGGSLSRVPALLEEVITEIRKLVSFPVICKINTNYDNYCDAAKAAESAGADALYTTNTPLGMSIDIETGKPALGNVKGPLCGPAITPLGIAKTYDIFKAIKIPIIASGGIFSGKDALQYLMAGAAAIGVGSASFLDPMASVKILGEIEAFLERKEISDYKELIGTAHK